VEENAQTTGVIGAVSNWFAHPFTSQGSAVNWILFVGLLIIAAHLWNTVLLAIKE
jgi:hypothetical protein